MRFKKPAVLLSFCFLIFVLPADADSSVWKVAMDGNTLFSKGTFRLLTQADYPLPGTFEAAYRTSSVIVFETDFQKRLF